MIVLPKMLARTATLTTRKAGDLIIGFLDGHLEETLSGFTIREFRTENVEKKGKTTTRLVAEPGDLIIH